VRRARLTLGDADVAVLRERLAVAEAALAKTEIRASVTGTVLSRSVEPGDVVQPGTALFELAGVGTTEVLVPLDEKNLSVLQLGQSAQCVADAYPTRTFAAQIGLIAPKIDPQRGTVDVRLTVDPAPDFLRQDMTVSVNIETGRRDSALVVPNDALLIGADGRASVVALRGGHTVVVPVELGLRSLVLSEVTGGLSDGEIVLADPSIDAGVRARATLLDAPSS
jgi:HlyD family secretion protein